MANSGIFARIFCEMFPDRSVLATHASETTSPPTPVPPQQPTVIGQGASNESRITILGVPNLFVDEGDRIVQFQPAFDEHTEETTFGLKILPDLVPHWAQTRIHRCGIKDAIAAAIRVAGQPPTAAVPANAEPCAQPVSDRDDDDQAMPESSRTGRATRAQPGNTFNSSIVAGRITSWGEEKFPRRKETGPRFYTSFAMHLDTATGERVLQGEGLKDAIAVARCEVGDIVSVRRLQKIKVQAFDEKTGQPKMHDGKPVFWDKWLWSISK
jgi:hypothetical protein